MKIEPIQRGFGYASLKPAKQLSVEIKDIKIIINYNMPVNFRLMSWNNFTYDKIRPKYDNTIIQKFDDGDVLKRLLKMGYLNNEEYLELLLLIRK